MCLKLNISIGFHCVEQGQFMLQFTNFIIFTSCNEVVAKVIFLNLSFILFTGGGCLPQCMLGYHPPEQTLTTPPEQTPPGADTPPQSRPPEQTPLPPGADTPGSRHPPRSRPPGADTPPRSRHHHPPPPGEQTPAYSQRAAGTHPTGMHSFYKIICNHIYHSYTFVSE